MDHGLSAEKLGHAPRDAVRIEAELRVETARIARLAEGRGADVLERRGPHLREPFRDGAAEAASEGSATGVLDVGDGVDADVADRDLGRVHDLVRGPHD